MDKLTIVTPYYENPTMLRMQLKFWSGYSSIVQDKILIILIDDGSPRNPAKDALTRNPLPNCEIQLYRIEQNIPWNYPGARNLGFHVAPDGWIYSSDMDHVLPWHSVKVLFSTLLKKPRYYMPERRNVDKERRLSPLKRHSESYIMTRETFWKAGGYNEDYSGMYFKAPTDFRVRLNRVASGVLLDDVIQYHFGNDVISDSQTTDFEKRAYAVPKNKRSNQQYLRFDWHRVQ
jgi:hypothetical protein